MHDVAIEEAVKDEVRGNRIKMKIITHFPAFNALMWKVVAKKDYNKIHAQKSQAKKKWNQ